MTETVEPNARMMKNALDVHNALDSPNRVSIGQSIGTNAQVHARSENLNCFRLWPLWPQNTKTSADELVAHPMYCAEVYGPCEVSLQFLAKSENMIVHGVGGRIILVSPHFFQ